MEVYNLNCEVGKTIMKIPEPISRLIESFERLPGVGPKTAQRLTFHLLPFPQEDLERFGRALTELKTGVKLCQTCKNVSEGDTCSVCGDAHRDPNVIMVVSSPLDTFALEKTGFKGVYHVLHGVIDPLNNIGPDELFINDLISRLSDKLSDDTAGQSPGQDPGQVQGQGQVQVEVILATSTGMEGESTAMYISRLIRESGLADARLKISRIARGLPVGGDIEYADDITLSQALEGRSSI